MRWRRRSPCRRAARAVSARRRSSSPTRRRRLASTNGADAAFEVRSIFKVSFGVRTLGYPLGWAAGGRLIGYADDTERGFVSLAAPYREPAVLSDPYIIPLGVSPDGLLLLGIAKDGDAKGDAYTLKLLASDDGREVAAIPYAALKWRKYPFAWSDNSRYVAYGVREPGASADRIEVYDAKTGGTASYEWTADTSSSATIVSVKLSNDSAKALIVYKDDEKSQDGQLREGRSYVMLAERAGGAFESRYAHPLADAGSADWVNDSQIVFAGADDTLFGYDARNGALTVLAEGTGLFSLSADKQTIAFSRGDDTVVAGRLQGNNVLNEAVVYQGISPLLLAWSPDGDRLLLEGTKPPYAQERAVPAPAEDTDGRYASFVLQFR
ncbi:WD40 repeat domain-containing protein [Cohnella rhizosphaerae]|uniref:Uncharacterized protein n=1 Tax=Cohnella rhizosphaerae TaxID=1457232 RepID=A0A9X4KQI1_9BACL|nr:hypothetical protein [Cohnella rhizosphaerae]MDG0809025.1 hypothetical protein [Cohnella rhizosphaerae]